MKRVKVKKSRRVLFVLILSGVMLSGLFGKFEKVEAVGFIVNSLGDTGAGSGTTGDLRYCITQANAAGGSPSASLAQSICRASCHSSLVILPSMDRALTS